MPAGANITASTRSSAVAATHFLFRMETIVNSVNEGESTLTKFGLSVESVLVSVLGSWGWRIWGMPLVVLYLRIVVGNPEPWDDPRSKAWISQEQCSVLNGRVIG